MSDHLSRSDDNDNSDFAPAELRTRMSVVLLTPTLDFGGTESQLLVQALTMRSQFDSLTVVTLSAAGTTARFLREAGIDVVDLKTNVSIRRPWKAIRLWQIFRQTRPQILHSRMGVCNFYGSLSAAVAGVPVRILEEVGLPRRSKLSLVAFRLSYRYATSVIAVSSAVSDYLIDIDRVPRKKVQIVYNSVDDSFFHAYTLRPRFRECKRIEFVTVGRLAPEKGHLSLLEALALIREAVDFRLTIIGDGSMRDDLLRYCVSNSLDGRVRFLGKQEGIARHLVGADVCVVPSLSEGFGIAAAEAMAAGLPVVASACGGLPEVLPKEQHEWLYPTGSITELANRLERIARLEGAERELIGDRNHADAKARFRSEIYSSTLTRLYREQWQHCGLGVLT